MKVHFVVHVNFLSYVIIDFLFDQIQAFREFVIVENDKRA